jgi:hypothetical protein
MPCWKQKRARYAELLSFVFPFRTSSLPARQSRVHHTCILSAPDDERGGGADVPALAERGRRRRREREAEGGVLGHGGYREQACVDMYRRTPTGPHMGAERVGGSPGARSSGSGTAEREHDKCGDDMAGEQARQVLRAWHSLSFRARARACPSRLLLSIYIYSRRRRPRALPDLLHSPGMRETPSAQYRNAHPGPSQCILIPLGGRSWLHALLSVSFMPPLLVSQSDSDAGQNGDLLDVLGEKLVHEGRGGCAADRPCSQA